MSIYSLGARGAVLAVMLALALTPTASAGTYQSACTLYPTQACMTADRHTYDDHYANAVNTAYLSSWLFDPATGNTVSFSYGWGVAGKPYATNVSLVLDGYWGNATPTGNTPVWVLGTFAF